MTIEEQFAQLAAEFKARSARRSAEMAPLPPTSAESRRSVSPSNLAVEQW